MNFQVSTVWVCYSYSIHGMVTAQQSLLGGIILKISTNLFLNGIVVRSGIFGTALKSLEVSKIEVALRLGTDL